MGDQGRGLRGWVTTAGVSGRAQGTGDRGGGSQGVPGEWVTGAGVSGSARGMGDRGGGLRERPGEWMTGAVVSGCF